jgi:hypothetical protein
MELSMKFPTVLLWINAACFLLFGAAFLVAPGFMAHLLTGVTPAAGNALIDIRATYGGMALGIGLFFAFCARRPETLRIGLIASLLVAAGIVFGRLTGIVVDGSPNTAMIALLVGDSLFILLFVIALRGLREKIETPPR